jgi:SAM-dependent methyltransferase
MMGGEEGRLQQFEYDEGVATTYDTAIPENDAELAFYLRLAREAQERGEPTLELACGTGRVTAPMAREGITVVGLDVSEAMLAKAREKSEGLENVRWVEGDMRSFELSERFGLITLPVGSFQLLLSTEDQMSCVRCAREHLTADGRFVLDLMNPNIVGLGEMLSTKRGIPQRRTDREYRHPESGLIVRRWDSHEYHPSKQQIVTTTVYDEVDADGVVQSRRYDSISLRLVFPFELEHLLARCGLAIETIYGDFEKSPYRGSSAQMLVVAKRAE